MTTPLACDRTIQDRRRAGATAAARRMVFASFGRGKTRPSSRASGRREPADEAAHSSSEHFNDVSTRFRSLFESRTANGFMKRITPNISLSATWWMTVPVPFDLRL